MRESRLPAPIGTGPVFHRDHPGVGLASSGPMGFALEFLTAAEYAATCRT